MKGLYKITLALLALSAVGMGTAHAQRGLPGQLGIGVNAGTVDGMLLRDARGGDRFYTELELTRCNRNHSYWSFTAGYLRKDLHYVSAAMRQVVPLSQYCASAGYNMPLVSDRGRNISLVCGMAAVVGYETSGDGKTLGDGARLLNADAFLYGAALSLSVEGYLSDRVVLRLGVRQRCLGGSPTNIFHTQIGLGVRIIIN